MPSVTTLLDAGKSPEDLIEYLLGDFEPEILETIPTKFSCNCDKKRVEKALIAVGKKELDAMIRDGEDIEVKCHFCNSAYKFTPEDLKAILARRLAEKVSVTEVGSVDSDR